MKDAGLVAFRILRSLRLAFSFATVAGIALSAMAGMAEELPETHLKVVGGLGDVSQYRNVEKPFWTETLKTASNGRVTAEVEPFDQMGIRGAEVIQFMRLGVISFGTVSLSNIAAEDAEAAALDLPGMNPDIATLRRAVAAYRETLADVYRERYGIEILALGTYPAQVLFCNKPISRLGDIAGKRVRVIGAVHADFVEGLGGTPVQLPFNQLIEALRRGAVDCAVTGTLSGNAIKLYEVTTHLYALPISWGPNIVAASRSAWDQTPPSVRAFLKNQLAGMEERIWSNADIETEQGIACNIGAPNCQLGMKAKMTLVPVQAEDYDVLRKVLRDVVLPNWARRCGDECVTTWNRTLGAALGVSAVVN